MGDGKFDGDNYLAGGGGGGGDDAVGAMSG